MKVQECLSVQVKKRALVLLCYRVIVAYLLNFNPTLTLFLFVACGLLFVVKLH